jgi:hypothetical protein
MDEAKKFEMYDDSGPLRSKLSALQSELAKGFSSLEHF